MATVDSERKLQDRVLHWIIKDLGYTPLGNLKEHDNLPVKEDLLRENLRKRGYSENSITQAVNELVAATENQADNLSKINHSVYSLLRYGQPVVKNEDGSWETVDYIEWDLEHSEDNDFYVAEEVSVLRYDGITRKRPDVVLYINGIALGIFELKRSCVGTSEGIRQLLTNQKKENILNFFSTAQFLFAGNESQGLYYGTVDTPEKYYLLWKEDKKATDDLSVSIRSMQAKEGNRLRDGVLSLCQKERFLSLIHDFVIFDAGVKKLARHNQYFANIAARRRIRDKEDGIIWDTQGSGKSLLMVWLTNWIIENISDSRVVIITDREELDGHIESLFQDVGKKIRRAKSGADLRTILNKYDDAIICSLIHKYGYNSKGQSDIDQYRKELLENLPKDFQARGNIVGFIDECHRTNSGKLHEAVKTLMPDAVLIGFTGTPLLKTDKKTSHEIFGPYIHTYKFDEGVEDGVILDLLYEARDVDQDLSSQDKVDLWFEEKTKGLTERAKEQLKKSWTSINKLYSSKQRLEKIAADIVFDMSREARLKTGRGTAMLVANSIYEACRYWDIFNSMNFTKCAIVTSYEPTEQSVRTATCDPMQESEDEYKKSIYERMLNGEKASAFEKNVIEQFIKEPSRMKLLIVVDKLLTGFDAPSATYLYIDKSMRDHDLFQAICRVNRPDPKGEEKKYGYIIDYMDLFRSVQSAVADYTTGAFDEFDKEDIDGLIKNRYDEAKAEMESSLNSLESLLKNVGGAGSDTDRIEFFCGEDSEEDENVARRDTLYALTASLTRSFADCCNKLSTNYGFTEEEVEDLRRAVSDYNKIRKMIELASCDRVDLKSYEPSMRFILDTYVRAEDSKTISKLGDMTLAELLLQGNTIPPADLLKDLPGDNEAKAETIDNNLTYEIVRKINSNSVYYGKLSEMLQKVIEQRKMEAIGYEEYLRQIVDLAEAILHPEKSADYPDKIKDSPARRALYDYFDCQIGIAIDVDDAIRVSIQPDWKRNRQKQQQIKRAIYYQLLSHKYDEDQATVETNNVFEIAQRQEEYDE